MAFALARQARKLLNKRVPVPEPFTPSTHAHGGRAAVVASNAWGRAFFTRVIATGSRRAVNVKLAVRLMFAETLPITAIREHGMRARNASHPPHNGKRIHHMVCKYVLAAAMDAAIGLCASCVAPDPRPTSGRRCNRACFSRGRRRAQPSRAYMAKSASGHRSGAAWPRRWAAGSR